jgi:hypothetical protein
VYASSRFGAPKTKFSAEVWDHNLPEQLDSDWEVPSTSLLLRERFDLSLRAKRINTNARWEHSARFGRYQPGSSAPFTRAKSAGISRAAPLQRNHSRERSPPAFCHPGCCGTLRNRRAASSPGKKALRRCCVMLRSGAGHCRYGGSERGHDAALCEVKVAEMCHRSSASPLSPSRQTKPSNLQGTASNLRRPARRPVQARLAHTLVPFFVGTLLII